MASTGIRVITPDAQYSFAATTFNVSDSGYLVVSGGDGMVLATFAPTQWGGAWHHGTEENDG